MYGNVSLDYWYTQDPLSWKPTAQRDTAGKEQDKELGKYANPALLLSTDGLSHVQRH